MLAVALLGLSKGGLAGMGLMSMPLMLFVMPPAAAAGLILPVLLTQDAFSVWLYRWKWDVPNLKLLLPAALAGIVLGFILFALLPTRVLLALLGVVTLGFAIRGLSRLRAPAVVPPRIVGAVLGMLSGFTSTVLHQGGPPFQIYLLPQKLPRDTFVATSVAFFAALNLIKLPGFIALGVITRDGIIVAAVAAPFALLCTWLGAKLVSVIEPARFYLIIHLLLAAVGVKLITDGLL